MTTPTQVDVRSDEGGDIKVWSNVTYIPYAAGPKPVIYPQACELAPGDNLDVAKQLRDASDDLTGEDRADEVFRSVR